MNITGIIGLVIAVGLIVWGMQSGDGAAIGNFWDPASVAITLGGTVGAVIFNYPASTLKKVGVMIKLTFIQPKYDPNKTIDEMVDYCKTARLKGILQLEEAANACSDPFTKSALMLIVDANDSEKVQSMLDDSIDFMCERHENNFNLWLKAGSVAPAFGMIGTLVGLINMLKGLNLSDASSAANLGQGMSTALITTFYGCIIAHVFCNPIANQLKYLHNKEVLCMQIVKEGALAIISGANPRYVEEKLRMMLPATADKPKGARASSASE